jgi:hypothetical protein
MKREMEKRGVALGFIQRTLAAPALVTLDKTDPNLTRSYASIPEFGGRVLRVVHRPEGEDVFVVTAHWDRGVKL